MKKLILTMIILINVFTNNIEAYNNNNLKFIGYSSIKKSIILEDNEKINLVINDKYNTYELFIPILGDFSIICDNKKELFNYYNLYKENKNKKGIDKIEYNNNNYYDIYFNFLGGKYYRIEKEYFSNLMITYINNIANDINNKPFFYYEY